MVSEVFWSLVLTSCVGLVLALARMLYKSKCYEINCLCCQIKRDIQLETNEHKFDIEHNIKHQDSDIKI